MKNKNLFVWGNIFCELWKNRIPMHDALQKYKEKSMSNNYFGGLFYNFFHITTNELNIPMHKILAKPDATVKELINILNSILDIERYSYEEYDGYKEFIIDIDFGSTPILQVNHIYMIKTIYEDGKYSYECRADVAESEWIYDENCFNVLLFIERNGQFQRYIDEIINKNWYSFYKKISIDDNKLNIFLQNIIKLTSQNLMVWNTIERESFIECRSSYQGNRIFIGVNHYSRILFAYETNESVCTFAIPQKSYIIKKFHTIGDIINCEEFDFLKSLLIAINNAKETKQKMPEEKTKIKIADVLVRTHSMECTLNNNHSIKLKCGIIDILTPNNEAIQREVLVGYCHGCGIYYIYEKDYQELKQIGVLLCRLFEEKEWKLTSKDKRKKYLMADQSLMRHLGYCVNAQINLSKEERQKILTNILDKKLMTKYEIINFLIWLIDLHKNDSRYNNARSKWEEDRTFVRDLDLSNLPKVKIDSLTIKKRF